MALGPTKFPEQMVAEFISMSKAVGA